MTFLPESFTFNSSMLDTLRAWKKRSKQAGDYWWRQVHMITGEGDYRPGFDEGMHWSDNPKPKGYDK